MGTFAKGVLGKFKGLVGSVVGSQWKGIMVMRSRPEKRGNASASPKQLIQQAKFSLMFLFLRPLTDLFRFTFERKGRGMSGLNKALSFNILQAITGTYPDFAVDYPKVQIGQGGTTAPQAAD